jgi:hypothetical protein
LEKIEMKRKWNGEVVIMMITSTCAKMLTEKKAEGGSKDKKTYRRIKK